MQYLTDCLTEEGFAWDFRAKSDFALDDACGQRDFDWPALDEESYRKPGPAQSVKVWSMASSSSRIPAQTVKAKKSAADAESLRELLDEAMEREAQRITARMKAFRPESENQSANEPISVIAAVKTIFIKIKTQCQLLSGFTVHIHSTLLNHKPSMFVKQHDYAEQLAESGSFAA